MTVAPTTRSERRPTRSLTPTLGQRLRDGTTWIWAIPVLFLVGIGWPLLQGLFQIQSTANLDPESANPRGAKAILEVLRGEGIAVQRASSLDEVGAVADPASTTLVVYDRLRVLSTADMIDLLERGFGRLVVVGGTAADALDVSGAPLQVSGTARSNPAGSALGEPLQSVDVGPDCEPELTADAPAVSAASGSVYSLAPGVEGSLCYPTEAGDLVAIAPLGDERALVGIGSFELLANDRLADDANAAMAMGLLGDEPNLVWYLPGTADGASASADGSNVGDLVPGWVTPAMLLLSACIIAAGIWRGRRFGPLVAERLPVVVRGAETLEGRARLYAASGARLRAADALRVGVIGRAATALNLGRGVGAREVADALAAATGRERGRVHAVLVDSAPASDEDLVALSDELLLLERELDATRPGATASAPRAASSDPTIDPAPGAASQPREDPSNVR